MSEIILELIYQGNTIKILCKRNEYMKDIFKRYLIQINKDINEVYFMHNGKRIKEELRLEEINNKDNEIKILVYTINDNNIGNKEILKQNKDIICPECGKICLIDLKDYKIKLNKCINKHSTENILLEEFSDLQKNNEFNIICN